MTTITRYRGDTYADEFEIKNKITGLPLNITGYTFLLTVNTARDPTNTTTQQYQIVGVIVSAVEGRVEFTPTTLQADRLGFYYYDVQMVDGAGRKRTVVLDEYDYVQDITKA